MSKGGFANAPNELDMRYDGERLITFETIRIEGMY